MRVFVIHPYAMFDIWRPPSADGRDKVGTVRAMLHSMAAATMGARLWHRSAFLVGQALQNPAILHCMCCATAVAQVGQLRLQCGQLRDAMGDVLDMFIQEGIDLPAILFRSVPKTEQAADFVQRHIERPAVPDELETLLMRITVETKIPFRARRRGQQASSLTRAPVADRPAGQRRSTG